MKRQRLQREEQYWYIDSRTLQVCYTNDWYFCTDDDRWKKGNYFFSREAAESCAESLEDFGAKLDALAASKAKNDTTFIKAVLSIVPAHSLAVERPKSILRPSKKKPDPEGAVIDLLSVIDEYKTAKNQINKDIAHYKELIAEAIQVSVKE